MEDTTQVLHGYRYVSIEEVPAPPAPDVVVAAGETEMAGLEIMPELAGASREPVALTGDTTRTRPACAADQPEQDPQADQHDAEELHRRHRRAQAVQLIHGQSAGGEDKHRPGSDRAPVLRGDGDGQARRQRGPGLRRLNLANGLPIVKYPAIKNVDRRIEHYH